MLSSELPELTEVGYISSMQSNRNTRTGIIALVLSIALTGIIKLPVRPNPTIKAAFAQNQVRGADEKLRRPADPRGQADDRPGPRKVLRKTEPINSQLMKLVLTDDEICQALLNCIVDGGVKHLLYADVTMDFDPKDYKAAKKKLKKPCAEDVYLQILKDGKALTFTDEAGKDPPVELTLKKAKKNFKNPKAILDLVRLLDPNVGYDSLDCYNVLQYAVFGELKYS